MNGDTQESLSDLQDAVHLIFQAFGLLDSNGDGKSRLGGYHHMVEN